MAGQNRDETADRPARADGADKVDGADEDGAGGAGPADDPELVVVAAVAANGVIGRDGGMPWHLPADLRRFKRLTTGHPVLLGRRTFESIVADLGGPLPGRTNVVLTTRPDYEPARGGDAEVVVAGGVDAALSAARARDDVAFVAGGARVYEQLLPRADRLELTELDAPHEGDTRFPDFERDAWRVVEREQRDGFAFVTYERR